MQRADPELLKRYLANSAARQRAWNRNNPEYGLRLSARRKADIGRHLKMIASNAPIRGISFVAADEADFLDAMSGPCHYCGYLPDKSSEVSSVRFGCMHSVYPARFLLLAGRESLSECTCRTLSETHAMAWTASIAPGYTRRTTWSAAARRATSSRGVDRPSSSSHHVHLPQLTLKR